MSDDEAFQAGREATGDGWSERNVRLLKGAVYIMGVLIVVGTVALVAAIVMKSGRSGEKLSKGFGDLGVTMPAKAAVISTQLDGDRLAVTLSTPQGSEVIVVDIKRGTVVGRVRLKTGSP